VRLAISFQALIGVIENEKQHKAYEYIHEVIHHGTAFDHATHLGKSFNLNHWRLLSSRGWHCFVSLGASAYGTYRRHGMGEVS